MRKRKTSKTSGKAAQADRERQLRELIEQAETKKSGALPEKESPHDFVERRMRSTPKPGGDK